MSDVGRATREMTKQVGQSSKLSLEHTDAPSMPSMIIIAMLGLARLFAEGTVLYSQGVHGAVYALIAILVASVVSSIAGFVFSALSTTQAELDRKTFAFVPAALLGAWFGLRIFKRLSDRQFDLIVNGLLIVSSITLIL
jgi:hypothetical protein